MKVEWIATVKNDISWNSSRFDSYTFLVIFREIFRVLSRLLFALIFTFGFSSHLVKFRLNSDKKFSITKVTKISRLFCWKEISGLPECSTRWFDWGVRRGCLLQWLCDFLSTVLSRQDSFSPRNFFRPILSPRPSQSSSCKRRLWLGGFFESNRNLLLDIWLWLKYPLTEIKRKRMTTSKSWLDNTLYSPSMINNCNILPYRRIHLISSWICFLISSRMSSICSCFARTASNLILFAKIEASLKAHPTFNPWTPISLFLPTSKMLLSISVLSF